MDVVSSFMKLSLRRKAGKQSSSTREEEVGEGQLSEDGRESACSYADGNGAAGMQKAMTQSREEDWRREVCKVRGYTVSGRARI